MRKILLVLLFALGAAPAFAQTPSPNLSDQQFLAADPTFQARVGQSALATCSAISSEGITLTGSSATALSLHLKRANFCANNIYPPVAFSNIKPVLAAMVATDATVMADATASGGTAITSSSIAATQAKLVTDSHIASALSGQFNALLAEP